jgi:ParB-like chromosome segregation protein Spo0J
MSKSRKRKVEPTEAEREAASKAQAEEREAQIKAAVQARIEKLEKAADEYEAEKAKAAEQAATQLKVHPFTAMLPMMSDKQLDALAVSIAKNGQAEPIIYDADGVLVDGRCRLEACQRVGIKPQIIALPPGEDTFKVSWSHNMKRNNLSLSQRAMGTAALMPEMSLSELVAYSGLSRATMFQAVYVRDNDPTSISLVMSGAWHLQEAYDLTRKRADQAKKQMEAVAMIERDAPDLAEAIQDERMNIEQAMKEFQARLSKQAALRDAKKRVKELTESTQGQYSLSV